MKVEVVVHFEGQPGVSESVPDPQKVDGCSDEWAHECDKPIHRVTGASGQTEEQVECREPDEDHAHRPCQPGKQADQRSGTWLVTAQRQEERHRQCAGQRLRVPEPKYDCPWAQADEPCGSRGQRFASQFDAYEPSKTCRIRERRHVGHDEYSGPRPSDNVPDRAPEEGEQREEAERRLWQRDISVRRNVAVPTRIPSVEPRMRRGEGRSTTKHTSLDCTRNDEGEHQHHPSDEPWQRRSP